MYQTHNGMNLSKSYQNPTSHFNRIRDYLLKVGEATREDILSNVFGKKVGNKSFTFDKVTGKYVCYTPDVVTRGWCCNVFSLSVKNGYFKKVRRGNRVFYSVGK